MGKLKIQAIEARINSQLNEHLAKMIPNFDDSITGFNEAWEIVSEIFREEIERLSNAETNSIA